MRQAVIVASALFLVACGPDPNAKLPGQATQATMGGATSNGGSGPSGGGGVVGTGGVTPAAGGSGGGNPFVGGTTGSTGGIVSSGGVVSSGGKVGAGGVASSGGASGAGGMVGSGGQVGSGGVVGTGGVAGSGGEVGIDGSGTSTAACANATPISGQVSFGTISAFCFVTCDSTTDGWGCDSFTEKDRTVTVNGKMVTCAGALPAKNAAGYYYFEIGPGGQTWDSIHLNGPKVAAASCPVPAGGFSP
jgi:hypothetical protein